MPQQYNENPSRSNFFCNKYFVPANFTCEKEFIYHCFIYSGHILFSCTFGGLSHMCAHHARIFAFAVCRASSSGCVRIYSEYKLWLFSRALFFRNKKKTLLHCIEPWSGIWFLWPTQATVQNRSRLSAARFLHERTILYIHSLKLDDAYMRIISMATRSNVRPKAEYMHRTSKK